jgi:predicted nuclease of predicted toxin-antitoxin system
MRLILDQGLPRDAASLLREIGYDCIHVGEIGMWAAPDREILAWADQQNAAVVTLDADFHAILAVSSASGPSVIRIRIEGLDAAAIAAMLRWVLVNYEADLACGCVVTVKSRKITSHKLPIGGSPD